MKLFYIKGKIKMENLEFEFDCLKQCRIKKGNFTYTIKLKTKIYDDGEEIFIVQVLETYKNEFEKLIVNKMHTSLQLANYYYTIQMLEIKGF
jgi:hypothetical protein